MLNDILRQKMKDNRGGKRKGAGRPKKSPTVTVSFRVKSEHAEQVKSIVNEFKRVNE